MIKNGNSIENKKIFNSKVILNFEIKGNPNFVLN
jgi:hypothetical protein